MVLVGCHVSIAGSIDLAVGRAGERGCDTFQIFSRNPRGWKAKDLDAGSADAFRAAMRASGLGPVVDHMPYLPNPASPDDEIYEKSVALLAAELRRCALLGIPYLVTHLGHHRGIGTEVGQARVHPIPDLVRRSGPFAGAVRGPEDSLRLVLDARAVFLRAVYLRGADDIPSQPSDDEHR